MRHILDAFYILWLRSLGTSEREIYQKLTGDKPEATELYSH